MQKEKAPLSVRAVGRIKRYGQILFPHTCALCRKGACLSDVPVCEACGDVFREMTEQPCLFCGLPAAECICPHNRGVRFLFWYDRPEVLRLIHMVKYGAARRKIRFLAERLAAICTEKYDAVTYVPRRKKQKRIYGYDHARVLATQVAKRLGLPCISLLESCSYLEQKLMSASQREQTMKDRFRVRREVGPYRRLLLVDDLCTTGATLRVCSALLRKAGAQTVSCVTLAKVPDLYRN